MTRLASCVADKPLVEKGRRRPRWLPNAQYRMALRKGKIVEAAGVQRSGGAGEKEKILGIAFRYLEIPPCTPAPLQSLRRLPFSLT
ncbi:hypothetical protein [Nostoc sp.]|uniref:hypothetical protein n=1 Tax=Nostoc sp. TaxID=1180 RepID=UPI002FFD49AE